MPIFFVLIILFHLLFWYYLSSFCAVYKNTQGALLLNTIQSVFEYLLYYTFIFCLIIGTMRYCALKYKIKCLFQFSNLLGDIFL